MLRMTVIPSNPSVAEFILSKAEVLHQDDGKTVRFFAPVACPEHSRRGRSE